MLDILYTLKNPSNEYRGHPFWSWNDKLDPEELRRQVRLMKEAGLGGYFMHARGGLKTEYLSDEWYDCIKACIDEGKKLNIESWSYDENGWPSGFCGGKITAMGDEYHVRNLICGPISDKNIDGDILGYYSISNSGHYRYIGNDIKTVHENTTSNEKILYVAHQKNPYYVDILNPKVVRAFIDSTYEEYKNKLGSDFGGKNMNGFFTDEPQFSRSKIPWSYVIPEEFEKTHGYSPIEHLICIFKDVNAAEKFRYDFWSVVSRLYTESFGKQIYDWCCDNGCEWTGHSMMEDNLYTQMQCTAGVMPIYEYMHMPGMDWLCRGISSPIIPKQVGSVAAQLGKKKVLSETFALSGWDVSFEELKWMTEWQYVNGVNVLCPHLESYSIKGLRKRDYPPSIFYHSPWWNEYKLFNEYTARLGQLLANGREIADVLLLHPIKSAWITYTGTNTERLKSLDRSFEYASNRLSGMHISYHYGDETIIEKHGSVDGDKFIIGNWSYKSIILPDIETIDEKTYYLLLQFLRNGGKVYSFGKLPYRINGVVASKIKQLNEQIINIPHNKELRMKLITDESLKNVTITDNYGEVEMIHCTIRDYGDTKLYYFVNLDSQKSYDAVIRLNSNENRPIIGYKLETMTPYKVDMVGGDIYMKFAPMQSYIILVGDDLPDIMKKTHPVMNLPLSHEWTIESSDENILTLDMCSYSVNNSEYSEYKPVLGVMDELLAQKDDSEISLKYSFNIAEDTDLEKISDLRLVIEYDDFEIFINGKHVRHDLVSWWKDKSFKTINIKNQIQNGYNEIIIHGYFTQNPKLYEILFGENVLETELNKLTYDTEIESIYIIGDFSVYSESGYIAGDRKALHTDGGFYITNRNIKLIGGEIVKQGYPFFAGKMKLTQNLEIKKKYGKYIGLDISKPHASAVNVYINDKFVKTIMWADYNVDISDYIETGDNKITFEIVTGNRNMLGPHHHPDGESYAVHPKSFGPNGNYAIENWRERYTFVKTGL